MSKIKNLKESFRPSIINLNLGLEPRHIKRSEDELWKKCITDKNKCFGYFPSMKIRGIDRDLPSCIIFRNLLPKIILNNKELYFNFLRMSLVQQKGDSPYHLDTDAATAITGEVERINQKEVWRLLINMSSKYKRTLGYIDADVGTVQLRESKGYIHCVDSRIKKGHLKTVILPERKGSNVTGVLFCANNVLHTGKDDKNGHFVAGYGVEYNAN